MPIRRGHHCDSLLRTHAVDVVAPNSLMPFADMILGSSSTKLRPLWSKASWLSHSTSMLKTDVGTIGVITGVIGRWTPEILPARPKKHELSPPLPPADTRVILEKDNTRGLFAADNTLRRCALRVLDHAMNRQPSVCQRCRTCAHRCTYMHAQAHRHTCTRVRMHLCARAYSAAHAV